MTTKGELCSRKYRQSCLRTILSAYSHYLHGCALKAGKPPGTRAYVGCSDAFAHLSTLKTVQNCENRRM